jgi:hypothetical protein
MDVKSSEAENGQDPDSSFRNASTASQFRVARTDYIVLSAEAITCL